METDKQTNPATLPKPEAKKGLGRGLAALLGGESFGINIVKLIVGKLDGQLQFLRGAGTTVRITIPYPDYW